MTDVQQGESTKTKKQKRAGKQPDQAKAEWDKLVAKGKKLVAALDSNERNLGELADSVKTKYREKSLARFAEEIGVKFSTLNRCRSTYRAWKGIEIKGPSPKSGVLQALAPHPAKEEIINANPNLGVREARSYTSAYRVAQGTEQDWRVEEARRYFAAVEKRAVQNIKDGHLAEKYMDPVVLGPAIGDVDKY